MTTSKCQWPGQPLFLSCLSQMLSAATAEGAQLFLVGGAPSMGSCWRGPAPAAGAVVTGGGRGSGAQQLSWHLLCPAPLPDSSQQGRFPQGRFPKATIPSTPDSGRFGIALSLDPFSNSRCNSLVPLHCCSSPNGYEVIRLGQKKPGNEIPAGERGEIRDLLPWRIHPCSQKQGGLCRTEPVSSTPRSFHNDV